jgi:glycosyltransferase involved in cell wall biosynthesis
MPRISVITPCYNGARFIRRTIESLQAQTFRDWEHIVVDDGSTDDSASVIAEYAARDPRVQLIRQPNGHVCKARNAGFAASDPDSSYLLFLDADDILEPRAIEKMLAYLDAHPCAGLAYCSVALIGRDDKPISPKGFDSWWNARHAPDKGGIARLPDHVAETGLPSLLAGFRAIPSTAFIRRDVFEATTGWDESFRDGAEDLDLVVQMSLMAPVHFLPLKLVRYRRHDANFSNQDFCSGLAQFRRKWWSNRSLNPTQQARLREAILFANELRASVLEGSSTHVGPARELGRGILQLCGAAFQT